MLTESAWAKINLYLHVTGRRADGYHVLDSLVVFAGAADRLSASPAETLRLELTGPFGAALTAEPDNLVLRAARALERDRLSLSRSAERSRSSSLFESVIHAAGYSTSSDHALGPGGGARLVLDKQLPVASGIGGGSADAAAALRLLARMWDVPQATQEMALALGADVPVCLGSVPCRMGGVGEKLSPAPVMPRFFIALVNPGHAVATQAVFAARTAEFSAPARLPGGWQNAEAMAADIATMGNDLEAPALAICPPIGDVLAALRATQGCLLARMSGSGATCFGLYDSLALAHAAASACTRPGWWSWGGATAPT